MRNRPGTKIVDAPRRRGGFLVSRGAIGAAFGFLWGVVAYAGPPIPFDTYSVTNGAVSTSCPVGATCGDVLTDNGFLQRQVSIGGATYIQQILTDTGVSGSATAAPFSTARGTLDFTNEDFVAMGNRGDGIASKQVVLQSDFVSPTVEDRFINITNYLFGWAETAPQPWVNVDQEISTLDYSQPLAPVVTFSTNADITSSNTSFETDQDINLYQYISLASATGLSTDAQKFEYQELSGIYQLTSHTAGGPNPLLPGGTNGGDFSYTTGNKLDAVWVGEVVGSDDPSYTGVQFGYTEYTLADGNDNPLAQTALFSLTNPQPVNWQQPPFCCAQPVSQAPTTMLNVTNGGPVPITPTAIVAPPSLPTGNGEQAAVTGAPVAAAGPPLGYDQWSVSGGTITPTTLPGSQANVTGNGLLQRFITVGGDEYIQTIVTDANVTGNPSAAPFTSGALGFYNESFVKVGVTDPSQQGIASNQHIESQDLSYINHAETSPLPGDGGQFINDAILSTGWARGASPFAPTVQIHQENYTPDPNFNDTTSMIQNFNMLVGGGGADSNGGDRDISITSYTGSGHDVVSGGGSIPLTFIVGGASGCTTLGGTVSGSNCILPTTDNITNPIAFQSNILSGVWQTGSNAAVPYNLLPNDGEGNGRPTNSGTVAFAPGQGIQGTYVGGSYVTSDPAGNSVISSTTFTNLSTGASTENALLTTPQPSITVTNVPTVGSTAWAEYFGAGTSPSYSATVALPSYTAP